MHCLDSLELRLVYSPLRFLHHNLLGCFRLPAPRLALSPDPEPRTFLVRIVPFIPLSYVQDWFWYWFYVQNLHRNTNTQSILVLLLEQVRTWAGRGPSARRGDKPRSINCWLEDSFHCLYCLNCVYTVYTAFTIYTACIAYSAYTVYTVYTTCTAFIAVPDCIGQYWVLLVCTGLYWVVLTVLTCAKGRHKKIDFV